MNDDPLIALKSGTDAKSPPGDAAAIGNIAERAGQSIPDVLSILPLRSFVIFPGTILPLTVGRAASIKLLDETLPQTKIIGLLTQRDETKEEPEPQDLNPVGTAAIVLSRTVTSSLWCKASAGLPCEQLSPHIPTFGRK